MALRGAGQREAEDLLEVFRPTFHYAPPALDPRDSGERELLLFHEFGARWYLGEKSQGKGPLGLGVGQGCFDTVWEGENRPSPADIRTALQLNKLAK